MIQDIEPSGLDNAYRPGRRPLPDDLVFAIDGQALACRRVGKAGAAGASFEVPRVVDLRGDKTIGASLPALTYLFALDGTACWYADARTSPPIEGFSPVANRELRIERRGPKALLFAAYTAIHLAEWYRTNRFCGSCGQGMAHDRSLRALRCPSCGSVVFPRLNPAVIVAVCDPVQDRLVLTRYAAGRYQQIDALVAGFVEIGETLEDCAIREVYEELGLRVGNIRYYKSQPWGVAGDILAGFWADVVGDTTIRMDESELGRAIWARPADIVGQPDDLSLTNEMMCVWRDERLGRRGGDRAAAVEQGAGRGV